MNCIPVCTVCVTMLYIASQTKQSHNILHNTQHPGAPDVTNPGGLKEGHPSPIQNTKLTKTKCRRRHSPLVPSNQGIARWGRWAPDRLLTRCALQSVRPSPPGTLAAPSLVRWRAASDEWLLRVQQDPHLRSPRLPHPQIFPFRRLRTDHRKDLLNIWSELHSDQVHNQWQIFTAC